MKHLQWKKLMVSVLACAMFFTSTPTAVLAQEASQTETADTQEEFQVIFSNDYAKVGEALTLEITGATDCTYQWIVGDNNEVISTENSYTPTKNDLEKFITVTVTSGKELSTASIYCSKLPVVYIDTENAVEIVSKEDYVNATMRIQGNDTFQDSDILYDGDIEIRGRGNSTWRMPKKPYKIKLDKKKNLFDMGKHKHWVLLANYSDESLMRNTLAYNLSGEMGMPQTETTWVDVILNGEYVGNYQFCEQIKIDDGNRVDIFDWESFAEDSAEIIADAESFSKDDAGDLEDYMKEKDMSWITSGKVEFNGNTYLLSDYQIEVPSITGGYLLELDSYYDELSKFKTNSQQPIMFKNPEFVYTNPEMMEYVQTYIQSFEDAVQSTDYTADYEGVTKHYTELFDFDSLVDYWLINEIFFNEEINKKSTYMYKDIDSLIKMGPVWDMDYSSGGEGLTGESESWATLYFNVDAQANMWYKSLIKDPYFILKAQERYWEIRNTNVQDMVDSIGEHYELLYESAAANAELWYSKQNFDYYTNVLRDWFSEHLIWLDAQMASEDSVLTSLGYTTGDLNLTLADTAGTILSKDTLSVHAAADALVKEGNGVCLQVSSDNLKNNADVYVNSKKLDSVTIGSDITITPEHLIAGEKNVIEVKVMDEGEKVYAQNCITVFVEAKQTQEITVTETTISKTYGDADFTIKATTNGDGALSYESDNSAVASVDNNGLVSIKGTGTAVITITAAETDKYKSAAAVVTITVSQKATEDTPQNPEDTQKQEQTITVPQSTIELSYAHSFSIGATTNGDGTLSYTSSNTAVATVDEKGVVNLKGVGTAIITITAAETEHYKAATATVTVTFTVDSGAVPPQDNTPGPGKDPSQDDTPNDSATAPEKVTGLKQTKATAKTITLSWKKISGASGYEVYRYNASTKKYVTVKDIKNASITRLQQKKLKTGTTYKYKVCAYKTVDGKKIYGKTSKVVSMTTAPAAVKSKLTATKNSIKVTWQKKTCTGYQIQYSTNAKFKKNVKTLTVKKAKTISKTIKKLKSNKKYYVRVRTYITLKGQKPYYSTWSTKNTKTK